MYGAEVDRFEVARLTTTFMFRNLPRTFTAHDLIAELQPHAGVTAFDFVYCPWDKAGDSSMGFGFVNFVDGRVARSVCSSLDGAQWKVRSGRRPIRVHPAHLQGLVPNLVRYCSNNEGAAIDGLHCPLIFLHGQRLTLHEAVAAFVGRSPVLSNAGGATFVPQLSVGDASTDAGARSLSDLGEQSSEDSYSIGTQWPSTSAVRPVCRAFFEDDENHNAIAGVAWCVKPTVESGSPSAAGRRGTSPTAAAPLSVAATAGRPWPLSCDAGAARLWGGEACSCSASACGEAVSGFDLNAYTAAWFNVNRMLALLQQRHGFRASSGVNATSGSLPGR